MSTMRAVVVDPSAEGRLTLGQVASPHPDSHEALVAVRAFSLNRGEVRRAKAKDAGGRIGWDIAGEVVEAAADGTSYPAGTRVSAFVPAANGWAERAAVPARHLAKIPEGVSDTDAAALPVAGLTALFGLERGRALLGQTVCVTGATGGVGIYGVQLARLMGARVVAQVRREEQVPWVEARGPAKVVVDETGEALAAAGPYQLVLDGVGGRVLSKVLPKVQTGGTAVVYGLTGDGTATLSIGPLLGSGDASVQGFNLYHQSRVEPAGRGLERLLQLVADGALATCVEREGAWDDVGAAATELLDRAYLGKAVLHLP